MLPISTKRQVKTLRVGEQQLVEVAKALSLDARLLILDEPTSALSEAEIRHLFDVIAALKADGVTLIYISHKFDEVFEIADRVTVLRDGEYIGTVAAADTDQRELIRMMVGRPLSDLFPRTDAPLGDEVLRVEELALAGSTAGGHPRRRAGVVHLRRGEILGVAGLMGAGRTELLEALFGVHARRRVRGRLYLDGAGAADHLAAGGDRCRAGVRHRGPQDAEPDHGDVGQAQRDARRAASLPALQPPAPARRGRRRAALDHPAADQDAERQRRRSTRCPAATSRRSPSPSAC